MWPWRFLPSVASLGVPGACPHLQLYSPDLPQGPPYYKEGTLYGMDCTEPGFPREGVATSWPTSVSA